MTDDDQLSHRFERDAVPLITAMAGHAVRLTRDLAGWLYRIMTNTHISRFRRQERRPTLLFTDEFSDGQLLSHHRLTAGPR